jgi:hypothetical protein
MQQGKALSAIGVGSVIVVSILIFHLVQSGSQHVCTPPTPEADIEKYDKIIRELGEVVDLGIKLSTASAGLGAALILGLKSGLRTSTLVNFLVFLAIALFVQSALYAVWWRMGIAELWLNDCIPLVADNRFQYRFEAQVYLFVAGLISLALIVIGALFTTPQSQSGGATT